MKQGGVFLPFVFVPECPHDHTLHSGMCVCDAEDFLDDVSTFDVTLYNRVQLSYPDW